MAGIVRARRELVDQQGGVRQYEKLDAQDADHVDRFEHGARNFTRLAGRFFGNRSRGHRHVEDVIAVGVIDNSVIDESTVRAPGGYYGTLTLEVNEGLE